MAALSPMKILLQASFASAPDAGALSPRGAPDASLACPAEACQLLAPAHEPVGAVPAQLQEEWCGSRAEWVSAMIATTPHLNPDGLKEALLIFERAIENLKQAKAADGIVASTLAAGGAFMQMPHLAAARTLRAATVQQKRALLGQLQHLRVTHPAGSSSSCSAQEVREMMQRVTPQPRQTADLRTANVASQQAQPRAGKQRGSHAPRCQGRAPSSDIGIGPVQVGRARSATVSSSQGETNDGARPDRERPSHTLTWSLRALSGVDPDCVIIVRRINRLGLKSARHLKQHFSSYGPVVRVLVAHSTVHPGGSGKAPRQRPSSLGFVHMSTPDVAQAILAMGPEQEVDGVTIRVQRFEGSACEKRDLQGDTGVIGNRQSSDAEASVATSEPTSFSGMGLSEVEPEKV